MPYTLDENGGVVWTDNEVDAGPGFNQSADQQPSVQDRLQMSLPQVNNSPVPDDILAAVTGSPQTTQPQLPAGTVREGSGGSVKTSGTDFGTFKKFETDGLKGLARDQAAARNSAVDFGNDLMAGVPENIEAQKVASRAVGEAEIAKSDEAARLAADYARKEKQMVLDNEADYATIQARIQSKMADYEAAVNDLAASGVNPGRAYSNLSNGNKAGVLVTAFVTDFLGSKGIKTHGMDYINQAIERDIQAQRDEIDLKKDVAQGRMNIYKMFKEQGDSDYEAAEKTRGALLAAFATEVKAKLATFDSPIARAKLQQADALFGEKFLKHKAEVIKAMQEKEQFELNIRTTRRGQDLNAAASSAALAWDKEKTRMTREAVAGGAIEEIKKNAVYDNDGKFVGYVAAGGERVNKVQDTVHAAQTLQRELKDLSDIMTNIYNGPGSRWAKDAKAAKYESRYYNLLYKIAKANDPAARFTEQDIQNAAKQVPFNSVSYGLFSGQGTEAVDSVLAQMGKGTFTQLNEFVNSNITPINDPKIIEMLGTRGASPGSFESSKGYALNSDITLRGDNKPSQDRVDSAVGKISADTKESSKVVQLDKTDDVLMAAAKELGMIKEFTGDSRKSFGRDREEYGPGDIEATATAPRWLLGLDELNDIIRTSTSNGEREKAVASLWEATKNADPNISKAAIYYLQALPEGKTATVADPWAK